MTLYVGIDVAKNKHDLACIDNDGEIIVKNFRFQNTYQGSHALKTQLEQLNSDKSKLHIAIEDTGHYAQNLVTFLQGLDYLVFTYNPLLIKEFVKSQTLRKTKTDKKDALTIARKLSSDNVSERYRTDETMDELKELTRYQNRLIHDTSRAKTLYVRTLDLMFPEFARIVGNVHNKFVYELLTNYPSPEKIKRAHTDSLLKIKRLTADKIIKIKEAANHTIGTSSFALQLELTQLIESIVHLKKQIDVVQDRINELLEQLNSPILSIPGIGNRLGAMILAEIRDIHNFKNPAQLLAFAGLEPAIYQSGQMDNRGHMVKHGSSYLRYALIQAAKIASFNNPVFRDYLARKRGQGKHFKVAVTHVAKKLVRVIFHLLINNQIFDKNRLR
ncbi:IS110 family transposase [Lactococcus garvieae]|uniref:IS110 family transposase n=1 Tax=Lactococcus garvieae TaxID=1363 RepID=UPI00254CD716|nr:IS110 family transposase [Lactococcus garvieae]